MPAWIEACLTSVRSWASEQDYAYRFLGDDLFALVPQWYRLKVADRRPIIADLARLLWMQKIFAEEQIDTVIWLDADTLVFDKTGLSIEFEQSALFGREHWLQNDKHGKPRVYRNVHNAFCAFQRENPVLEFLIYAIERLVARVDAMSIAPQFVGPKLLGSLHNLVGFQTDDRFGAISPMHATEIVKLGGLPPSLREPFTSGQRSGRWAPSGS